VPDLASRLYIVATPIGNLSDFSSRAVEVLKTVDIIVTENSHHSKKLLAHFGISSRCHNLNNQNEEKKSSELLKHLKKGKKIALISDAGTPLVSDPGYRLVSLAHQNGVSVSPIPGASAALAALCVSGLPANRFVFEGFLPAKSGPRRKKLQELQKEDRTLVFFEAPHRLCKSLEDMQDILGGDREATLARELTKLHEEVCRSTISELLEKYSGSEKVRGEIVLIVRGYLGKLHSDNMSIEDTVRILLEQSFSVKSISELISKKTGCPKSKIYDLALKLHKG
jgi:16S rRNA (cytidine1402-2'-O)-methyltransferase